MSGYFKITTFLFNDIYNNWMSTSASESVHISQQVRHCGHDYGHDFLFHN